MRKRKLDPKIIRNGDRVRIVTPEIFVRCGYPLCKADLREDIAKNYGKIIEDLIYSVEKGDKLLTRDEKGLYPNEIPTLKLGQPIKPRSEEHTSELQSP